MLPEESRGRQEHLNKIILELSETVINEDSYVQYMNRFSALYQDNFKHQYSDFFPIILKVLEDDNLYNIEYLSNNLDALGTYLDEQSSQGITIFNSIYIPFTKLCDHLDLQIRQTNYYKSMLLKSNDASRDLQSAVSKLDDANKRVDNATKRANTMQTELISILSIFAAIVMTFSGSFTFLGNSMTAISNTDNYESVIIIAIICGMVLFNTIFLMMYFVSKLAERNVYAKCRFSQDCSKCLKDCNIIKKIRKRLPYVFYFNLVTIIGIIIDLIIWFLDIQGTI